MASQGTLCLSLILESKAMAETTIELTLPEYGGSRAQSADFAASLPADLSETTVRVDCSKGFAISQSFSDELCKQVLQTRHASHLILQEPPARMAAHSARSAALRALEGLQIIARP